MCVHNCHQLIIFFCSLLAATACSSSSDGNLFLSDADQLPLCLMKWVMQLTIDIFSINIYSYDHHYKNMCLSIFEVFLVPSGCQWEIINKKINKSLKVTHTHYNEETWEDFFLSFLKLFQNMLIIIFCNQFLGHSAC